MHVVLTVASGFLLALVAGWIWRRWRIAQLEAKRRLAILVFEELEQELRQEFLAVAAATGMPRGLRWKDFNLNEARLFARDLATGELIALVSATISFEAIAGGDMEGVEAVGNLRFATAVFVHRHGQWTTDGRVIFNLEPSQACEHYRDALVPVSVS